GVGTGAHGDVLQIRRNNQYRTISLGIPWMAEALAIRAALRRICSSAAFSAAASFSSRPFSNWADVVCIHHAVDPCPGHLGVGADALGIAYQLLGNCAVDARQAYADVRGEREQAIDRVAAEGDFGDDL